jgi:hypothetical protein
VPFKTFGCSICGKQAPAKLRLHGTFEERMKWLREHREKFHPRKFRESIRKGIETRKRNQS